MAITTLVVRGLQEGALLTSTPVGNAIVVGVALAGLFGAGSLLGTARLLRAERRDPLNDRHYLNF